MPVPVADKLAYERPWRLDPRTPELGNLVKQVPKLEIVAEETSTVL